VSFAARTLCVASPQVFIVVSLYFVIGLVRKLLVTPSYFLVYRSMNTYGGIFNFGHSWRRVISKYSNHLF
jgi:hypothetical protein